MTEQTPPSLQQIVEALLFASSEPLPFQKIKEVIAAYHPVSSAILREALDALAAEYKERAYSLQEIAQGYILRTKAAFAPYLEILRGEKRGEKLSMAASEVLAIIAYRQPITRPQVEALRGIDCSGVFQTLLERQLIVSAGKLEAPGRPTLFATTKQFLQHYGLKSLQELPPLDSLPEQKFQ